MSLPDPCTILGRWKRRKEARPEEIINAALDLFVERGFAATVRLGTRLAITVDGHVVCRDQGITPERRRDHVGTGPGDVELDDVAVGQLADGLRERGLAHAGRHVVGRRDDDGLGLEGKPGGEHGEQRQRGSW